MDNIYTLTQLLTNSGCDYTIFDLGRRIQPVANTLFANIEQGQQPYPYPIQRHAQLAIAYWNHDKQPWIWFLTFPLDERGLLKQSDVGNFIRYVLEAMGSRLNKQLTEEQQQALANNPYTFKPSEDKMAVFHSQLRAVLSLPVSQYYKHAQHYFSGEPGWDQWQTVGLQGMTDMCARLDNEQNEVLIRKAISHLPTEPLYALLGALEHSRLPEKLALSIQDMALNECDRTQPDLFLLSALVRALSGAERSVLQQVTDTILASPQLSHQEVLIGLAGRSWQILDNEDNAELFLLRLALTGNQLLFNQLFSDLVMLPALRMVLLPLLHNTPSPELAEALIKLQRSLATS